MQVVDDLPLSGLRIVVTRAAHQAQRFARLLEQNGASVILLPMISITSPPDTGPLKTAAAQLSAYEWIVFTSSNAVDALMSEVDRVERPLSMPLIAAIGAATRSTVEARGLTVAVTPRQSDSESLAEAFAGIPIAGTRLLLPCAVVTRDVLPALLRDLGGIVEVVHAYQNLTPPRTIQDSQAVFQPPLPDWVTFTSPSAVHHSLEIVGGDRLANVRIATIGRVTSAAVHAHGLSVQAEAAIQTTESLLDALVFASRF